MTTIRKNDDFIKEDEFDFLGLIPLSYHPKTAFLMSRIDDDTFISRSAEYYQPKTYNELVDFRERLKSLFPLPVKHAFMVCEYMLNASCRVFYEDYKRALKKLPNHLDISRACMEEDVRHIVACLENKVVSASVTALCPYQTDVLAENRFIEGDHKMHLYQTIKNVTDVNHVVCPLFSGILIGPFFKILHGIEYDYVKFGIHGQRMKPVYDAGQLTLDKITVTSRFPDTVCLFDGNIGSGVTIAVLKELLAQHGVQTKVGLLEISYEYMERNNDFHQMDLIDYKTYVSTRYKGVTEDLINTLCSDPRHYFAMLKSHGFHNPFLTDIELLYHRGKTICDRHQIQFEPIVRYDCGFVLSVDILNGKIRYLEGYPVDKAIGIIADYPVVNVIDLDKSRGGAPNWEMIARILKMKKVRVGGGIRTKEEIQRLLDMGADKVIVSTYATPELLAGFDPEKIIVGLDSIDRKTNKAVDIPAQIKLFEPYCREFNYVSVSHDGKGLGGDVENAIRYARLTSHAFNCVGGICSKEEMRLLTEHHIGCTIGRKVLEGYFG